MNTETRNYENERAVLATAIMCDNRQAKLEEKARKYDELKEALKKIKKEFSEKEKSNDWVHPEDSLIWREAIDIIDKHTEGLI